MFLLRRKFHPESRNLYVRDVIRNFCCCENGERQFEEQKFIETKIGFHFEVVGFI